MSHLSLNLPRLGHEQRKVYLEDHYGAQSTRAIALACGVTKRTIDRDIRRWKDSGDYDEWLDEKWHYYLESEDVDVRTKFIQLTRLKERRMIRVVEKRVTQVDINLAETLRQYKGLILELSRELEADAARENHSHP